MVLSLFFKLLNYSATFLKCSEISGWSAEVLWKILNLRRSSLFGLVKSWAVWPLTIIFGVMGVFLAVSRGSGYYGIFQGCAGVVPGVPGVFWGCSGGGPGCSGSVPGCSGVFRDCSGFYRHPAKLAITIYEEIESDTERLRVRWRRDWREFFCNYLATARGCNHFN